MLDRVVEFLTGKDRVTRIAQSGDRAALRAILRTVPVLIPLRPVHTLDARTATEDQIREHLEANVQALSKIEETGISPWVLEFEDYLSIPVFSNQRYANAFVKTFLEDSQLIVGVQLVGMLLHQFLSKMPEITVVALNPPSRFMVELDANLFR